MSAITSLALIQAILKFTPEVISIIEGIVGHGNPIEPTELPKILTQAAELSKAAAPVSPVVDPIENNSVSDKSAAAA